MTEEKLAAADRRALFVGVEAYTEAGKVVLRDLVTEDGGCWSNASPVKSWGDGRCGSRAERVEVAFGEWPSAFGDAIMTIALLDRFTHHCDIVEIGNGSWRSKSRDEDQTTRAGAVSATPHSSDGASATAKARRSKGAKLDADQASILRGV